MKSKETCINELCEHIGLLYGKALEKTKNVHDAEDIVYETCLRVLKETEIGKNITHIKAYLVEVLNNLYYEFLRSERKHKTLCNSLKQEYTVKYYTEDFDDIEKVTELNVIKTIHRELAYLSKTYREIMELHYFEARSCEEIAKQLRISVDSVRKRLERGKKQMVAGIINREEQMKTKKESEYLSIGFSGIAGLNGEPENISLSLIEQNILIVASEKAMTPAEIGKKVGTPTVFVEEFIEKLLKHEFMSVVNKTKVRTEFLIVDLKEFENKLKIVEDFAGDSFDAVKGIINELRNEYKKLGCLHAYDETQLYVNAVVAVSSFIQIYLIESLNLQKFVEYPNRADGGNWIIDIGFKNKVSKMATPYLFLGGPRTLTHSGFKLIEYDTAIGKTFRADYSHGFTNKERAQLFYDIIQANEFDPKYIPLIADLVKLGFLCESTNEAKKYDVKIPIISQDDYERLEKLGKKYSKKIIKAIGEKLVTFVENNPLEHPKWINSKQFFIHIGYLSALPMSYVFKAAEKGIIKIEKDKNYPICVITESEKNEND